MVTLVNWLGVWRLVIDTPVSLGWEGYADGYEPGTMNYVINNTYFQYFSLAIFLIYAAVMAGVSYVSVPPDVARRAA